MQKNGIRYAAICAIAFIAGLSIRYIQKGIENYSSEEYFDWKEGLYSGSQVNGIPNGEGKFIKDDITYIGQWDDGELSSGIVQASEFVYEGGIQDFKFQGYGICQYNDGRSFRGYWNQGKKDGLGLLYNPDGKMTFSFYKEDVAVLPKGQYFQHGDKAYGIDVSRYQGRINWQDLYLNANANGGVNGELDTEPEYIQPVLFSFVKSTEGSDLWDNRFVENFSEAKRCGILRGAYHFFSLKSSGKSQAQNFIDHTILESGDFPPVLDLEQYEVNHVSISDKEYSKIIPEAKEWLQVIENHYGVRPIIYTNMRTYTNFLSTDNAFSNYYYWISYPGTTPPNVKNCIIWQFHHHGKVVGINDNFTDINLFFGSYSDLKRFVDKEGVK